jgi:hypothetical protein
MTEQALSEPGSSHAERVSVDVVIGAESLSL